MKFILSLIVFFIAANGQAQSLERKIIVQNGQFYYMTVDENLQLATLYTGAIGQPIKDAKAYAVPAGRGISAETNPLAWDLDENYLYAINFLDHSLNDRNESIKKIPITALRKWGPALQTEEVLMESIDQHLYQINEPYLFVKERSKFLNHFYFDAILHENQYWVAMANNDELTLWCYTGEGWKHSEVIEFPITNYFNLISSQNKLWLTTYEGDFFEVGLNNIGPKRKMAENFGLGASFLLEDRDENKTYVISPNTLNFEKTLTETLFSNGQLINLKN